MRRFLRSLEILRQELKIIKDEGQFQVASLRFFSKFFFFNFLFNWHFVMYEQPHNLTNEM